MTKRLAFILAAALGIGGACAGSGTGRVDYAASVSVRSPELVTVEPDVYVLADADEPVFYTDNHYWLYRDNRWYRSNDYRRGWVHVSEPAPRLRRIHQPTAYVRYRVRHQEARNTPRPAPAPHDPWRQEYDRPDAPSTLPPHAQQPLQPTAPQQAPTPYPRPPQAEPPTRDHRVDAQRPRATTSPDVRWDPRDHGSDGRPQPPGQVDHDGDRDRTPPGHDVRVVPPREPDQHRAVPPPARVDDRDSDRRGNTARDNRDDDKRKRDKDDQRDDKNDQKRDY